MPEESSGQTHETRIARLEFTTENVTQAIREVRDQLERLNTSSMQIHQITALLDQLSTKITQETAQLQASLKIHIERTDTSWRDMEGKHSSLNLLVATQKAGIDGQIRGAKSISGIIAFLCALIMSLGTWVVNRELESVTRELQAVAELRRTVDRVQQDLAVLKAQREFENVRSK